MKHDAELEAVNRRMLIVLGMVGLSQTHFAEKAGVAQSQINDIVNGKANVTLGIAICVIRTFDLRAEWLLFGKGRMTNNPNCKMRSRGWQGDPFHDGMKTVRSFKRKRAFGMNDER